MSEVPRYVIYGHPNEGKSSVVATLTEDDSIRISDLPGETQHSRSIPLRKGREILVEFFDTPGFQNPRAIKAAFDAALRAGLDPVASFLKDHLGKHGFAHDCELLRPLAEGAKAGVIYVVDSSRMPGAVDLCEIEVLRLTGLPRIALLNPKGGVGTHEEKWKEACKRAFSRTMVFDAHAAGFEERLRVMKVLGAIDDLNSGAMEKTVEILQADRLERLGEVAETILGWVVEALEMKVSIGIKPDAGDEEILRIGNEGYWKEVSKEERATFKALRGLLRHRRFEPVLGENPLLAEQIDAKRTWEVLGLTRRQLVSGGIVSGAGSAVGIDLALGGSSLGLGALAGGVAGGTLAFFGGGAARSRKVVGHRVGSDLVEVGPNPNPQFPLIVFDRALLYTQILLARTHARRDGAEPPKEGEKQGVLSKWSSQERAVVVGWLKNPRREEARLKLRGWLIDHFGKVSEAETG
ncbi:MAG: DUF3482 domain-containing protein [Puniceicoccaceae bacterium]